MDNPQNVVPLPENPLTAAYHVRGGVPFVAPDRTPTDKEIYVAAVRALRPGDGMRPVAEHDEVKAYRERWNLK